MTKLEQGRKNHRIVEDKVIMEKIKFKGKKIIRERVEKIWNIPEVITNDIGFQLMFGFDSPVSPPHISNGLNEYSLDNKK